MLQCLQLRHWHKRKFKAKTESVNKRFFKNTHKHEHTPEAIKAAQHCVPWVYRETLKLTELIVDTRAYPRTHPVVSLFSRAYQMRRNCSTDFSQWGGIKIKSLTWNCLHTLFLGLLHHLNGRKHGSDQNATAIKYHAPKEHGWNPYIWPKILTGSHRRGNTHTHTCTQAVTHAGASSHGNSILGKLKHVYKHITSHVWQWVCNSGVKCSPLSMFFFINNNIWTFPFWLCLLF